MAHLAPKEVEGVVRDAGLSTLLTFAPPPGRATNLFGSTIDHLASALPSLRIHRLNDASTPQSIRKAPPLITLPLLDASTPAAFIYTSGSTGKPKGVMLTHANLVANLRDLEQVLGFRKDDRILGVLPLFHSFGLTAGLLASLLSGAMLLPLPAFHPRVVLETIKAQSITLLELVPSMYRSLISFAEKRKGAPEAFSSLRLAVAGGAPLPHETMERFKALTGQPIHEGYGASETSPVIAFNPPGIPPEPGTVGFPLPSVHVEIRDDEGRPAKEDGEIWVQGPNVFGGYYNRPKESSEALVDGWYRTGDRGRWDQGGRLIICGRTKRMIIVGGENVYPAEVEDAVLRHPQVVQAVALGQPDTITGESIRLVVEWEGDLPQGGPTVSVLSFLRNGELLAPYKMPKVVKIAPIPLLPTGKPDIPALLGNRDPIAHGGLAG